MVTMGLLWICSLSLFSFPADVVLNFCVFFNVICERGGGSIRVCVCMFLLFFVGVGLFVFCGGKLFCGKRGVGGGGEVERGWLP